MTNSQKKNFAEAGEKKHRVSFNERTGRLELPIELLSKTWRESSKIESTK